MQSIPSRQNEERFQKLLRARQRVYSQASRIQLTQLTFTVAVPLVAAVIGIASPDARPWVAVVAFFAVVADVLVLDRRQRQKLRLAAKISEQFDCELFGLDWNVFVAGKRALPEDIDGAARAYRGDAASIRDWYPPEAAAAPPHMARIICQRANLQYDSRLREQLGDWLLWAVVGLSALLAVGALVARLDASSFATTVLAPATPVIIWAMRERYRQHRTQPRRSWRSERRLTRSGSRSLGASVGRQGARRGPASSRTPFTRVV